MQIYKNEYFRITNFSFFIIMLIWYLFSPSIHNTYYSVGVCYIICNVLCSLLTKKVFFAWPVMIIRITGFFRYILISLIMSNENKFEYSWIMIIEIIAEYFAIWLFAYINKSWLNKNIYCVDISFNKTKNTKIGISFIIIIIIGSGLVLTNRNIFRQYFSLSTSKMNLVYANGLIALIVSAFFLLIFIKIFEYIDKMDFLPTYIRIILILGISIFYINGISVSSNDVSRWSMIIGVFVIYNIIVKFHPASKKILLIVFGFVLLIIVFAGTYMKLNVVNNAYGIVYNKSLQSMIKDIFSYDTLNAYFAGPKNIDYGMSMVHSVSSKGVPKVVILISDIFANFPLLNRFFSVDEYTSVSLFNYEIYHSKIAVDQIIPLCVQMYNIFGFLFFVPEIFIVYCALKFNFKIEREENILKLYCLSYLTFSLSLVNCNNLNIMCQGLWIQILPIYLIYIFNVSCFKRGSPGFKKR